MAKRVPENPEDPAQKKIAAAPTLQALAKISKDCKACDLWKVGTQTVFGEGEPDSKVMLVGEVPGDQEDRAGKPFVGPAGKLLDKALVEAGIDRGKVYVTNVVKHFSWEARGKRRIHKKPTAGEITACRPWLEGEVAAVKPHIVVLLGATAAQSVMGPSFRVSRQRGEVMPSPFGVPVLATVHPSSILRATDDASRKVSMAAFVADLKVAAGHH